MQVMETYSPDKSQPDLITHVKVEAAHESDAHAVLPAIEEASKRQLAPTELLADSLYGGDDNVERAAELGVTMVSPTMGSQSHKIGLADFTFTDSDEMTACPTGQTPKRIKTGKQGGKIVCFDKATCDKCPRQSDCPVKRDKRNTTISYDAKALRLSRRRTKEKTEAFREAYRFRAGVEGTMSDLDRVTGIKHLRVRGMRPVRVAAVLKATGLNILRASAFRTGKRQQLRRKSGGRSSHGDVIDTVKEQIRGLWAQVRQCFGAFRPASYWAGHFTQQAT